MYDTSWATAQHWWLAKNWLLRYLQPWQNHGFWSSQRWHFGAKKKWKRKRRSAHILQITIPLLLPPHRQLFAPNVGIRLSLDLALETLEAIYRPCLVSKVTLMTQKVTLWYGVINIKLTFQWPINIPLVDYKYEVISIFQSFQKETLL